MFSTLSLHATAFAGRLVPTAFALLQPMLHGSAPASGAPTAAPAGAGAGVAGPAPNPLFQFALPILAVGFIYLFMFRPASKQRQEQETLQKGLVKGDRVVTTSGIIGTISGVDDQFVTLEISEKVRVKFLREAISRRFEPVASAAVKSSDKAPGGDIVDAKK